MDEAVRNTESLNSYDDIKDETLKYFVSTSEETIGGMQRCTDEKHARWLFDLVKATSNEAWICEIGVLYGHLTVVMGLASRGSDRRIIAIDHMIGNHCMDMNKRPKCIYLEFIDALVHFNVWNCVIPFPMKSHGNLNIKFDHNDEVIPTNAIENNYLQAFDMLKTMDAKFELIYIDGNHFYLNVFEELKLYTQLLKPGGCIAGDDCDAYRKPFLETFTTHGEMENNFVAKAVVEFFRNNNNFMPIEVPVGQFGFIKCKDCT